MLQPAPDRVFVLQSAGNLATTQEVLDRIQQDLETPGDHENLATVTRMFQAALYIGRLLKDLWQTHILAALKELPSDADFEELAARPRIQSV